MNRIILLLVLNLVLLIAAAAHAETGEAEDAFTARGEASVRIGCWAGNMGACDQAESRMHQSAQTTCGQRPARQLGEIAYEDSAAIDHGQCVFSCAATAQFTCD